MQNTQQRVVINFTESFKKTVAQFEELSETKKRDLERARYLEELRQELIENSGTA